MGKDSIASLKRRRQFFFMSSRGVTSLRQLVKMIHPE